MLEAEFNHNLGLYSPNYIALTESEKLYRELAETLNKLGTGYMEGSKGENLTFEERGRIGMNLIMSGIKCADRSLITNQYQLGQLQLELEAIMYQSALDPRIKP